MIKYIFMVLLSALFTVPILASETIIFHEANGIGTFSAGENDEGSVFWGSSISADWLPASNDGLFFGIETGLLSGQTQGHSIYGIPAILRIGWSLNNLIDIENSHFFLLGKVGWGFGLWGSQLEEHSTPGGVVAGLNIGCTYLLADIMGYLLGVYTEIGYNYYGLARNSEHPKYPLGYGSGKTYVSIGISVLEFSW